MCSLAIECVLSDEQHQRLHSISLCSLTTECVLVLKNVFSYYRMCSLTIECVLSDGQHQRLHSISLCSFTIKCVLFLQLSYDRICTIEYAILP